MDRLTALLAFYEEDPDDAFTRFAIASEYLKKDNKKEALSFFKQLVQDIPDYVGTYYHLGKLYEVLDQKEEAIRTYESGVQVATRLKEFHARAELQDALLAAQGFGFDDDDA